MASIGWRVALLLVVVSVALAGCLHGGDGTTGGEPTGDELVRQMGENFEDVKSYEFEVNQEIETKVERDGEVREQSNTLNHSGVLNIVNGKVKNSTVSGEDSIWAGRVLNAPGETAQTEIYLTEDAQYVGVSNGENKEWVVTEDPAYIEEQKETGDRVGVVSRIAPNSTVEYEGDERVEGTDTYRVGIEPDADADYFDEISEGGSLVEYEREEANITVWLDTETYLPVRIDENVVVTNEGSGDGGNVTTTFDVDSTVTVTEYKQEHVEIEVPQEAIEATE